jgi:ribonuclease BN (tRNA processing enzyme)
VTHPADWRTALTTRRPPRRTDADHKVVLLGTGGGAYPKATRAGSANAVVAGDAVYLVDCGEGAHRQVFRAGLTVNPVFGGDRPVVRSVFITHLHADHVMDLAHLFMGSWPRHVIDVYGPGPPPRPIPFFPRGEVRPLAFPDEPLPGTRALVDHLLRGFAYNINLRIADEGRTDVTESVRVHEIDLGGFDAEGMEPVVVYPEDDHGVRVSAVLVDHAPVFPAFGFRFDTPEGSVAFSGDTGPCENLVTLAAGADVLVHEVIDIDRLTERLSRMPNFDAIRNHLAGAHSSPAQVGEVATRAGVGMVVLSHLVPGDFEITEDEWEDRVRPHFSGEVVCGVDLDEFPLRNAKARSKRPSASA